MIGDTLQEAVDAGAVPSVAAIAADRSGVIYGVARALRRPVARTRSASTPISGSCR
jgi:hypothetical protein